MRGLHFHSERTDRDLLKDGTHLDYYIALGHWGPAVHGHSNYGLILAKKILLRAELKRHDNIIKIFEANI